MKERGIVLIGALMVLIIISIMAISLGKFSIGSKQIASSNTSGLYSSTAADNAIRVSEYLVSSNAAGLDPSASGAIASNGRTDNWWQADSNWTCSISCAVKTQTLTVDSKVSKYNIEKMTKVYVNMEANEEHGISYYRLLSKASGAGSTETMLMSYSGAFE